MGAAKKDTDKLKEGELVEVKPDFSGNKKSILVKAKASTTEDGGDEKAISLASSQNQETSGTQTSKTHGTTNQTASSSSYKELPKENDPYYLNLLRGQQKSIRKENYLDENGLFDKDSWQAKLGLDPEYVRQQNEARERSARMSLTASNLSDAFKAVLMAVGAGAGGLMPKLDMENNQRKAQEEIYTAQGLQQAENNRLAEIAMNYQKNGGEQMRKAQMDVLNLLAKTRNESDSHGTNDSNTDASSSSKSASEGTNQQQAYKKGAQTDSEALAQLVASGYLTPEEARALLAKKK